MNGVVQLEYREFVNLHEAQLLSSSIPEHFWRRLHEKLLHEIYDANDYVLMQRVEYEDSEDGTISHSWDIVVECEKMLASDDNNIFLVDHAWTFEAYSAKQILNHLPDLCLRMASLMDVDATNAHELSAVQLIYEKMWKFCRHYKITSETDPAVLQRQPELQELRWYVLDEVGSRIQHSDDPTCRMVPFFYVPRSTCYSIFWPVVDLQRGDSVTIDYIEHIKDTNLRPYYLLPWQPEDFSTSSKQHNYVLTEEFFNTHRIQEIIPVSSNNRVIKHFNMETVLVYTDIDLVKSYLTAPTFRLVDTAEKANVRWLQSHFKDFEGLLVKHPDCLINQFPGEHVLTVKDLFASMVYLSTQFDLSENEVNSSLECPWYPVTFNLVYELPQFVAYFQSFEKTIRLNQLGPPTLTHDDSQVPTGRKQNLWILKPWNLGRSVGIVITDNLDRIIRTCDTNPLIASRYVTEPVLFYRSDLKANVKFDIRYCVLVRSVKPLVLYTYKVFWLRFANKAFTLNNLDDYGTHLTVMNYRDDEKLKQVHHEEFIELFNQQYPNYHWSTIQTKIFDVLVKIFQASVKYPYPRGMVQFDQSRALYAVDLLLEWRPIDSSPSSHSDIYPVVCEVNFCPDCERACLYHPNFFNDVFSCLFLDAPPEECNMIQLT